MKDIFRKCRPVISKLTNVDDRLLRYDAGFDGDYLPTKHKRLPLHTASYPRTLMFIVRIVNVTGYSSIMIQSNSRNSINDKISPK